MISVAKFSVNEFQKSLQQLIHDSFATVCVYGEVSNCVQARSGHCYFTLKDEHAEIKCVFFKHSMRGQTAPSNGEAIQVVAQPSIYLLKGSLQLIVKHYMPFGIGALIKKYQEIKEQLEKQGVFDQGKKRPLVEIPQTIGIVTSPQADALIDIIRTLKRRSPWIEITIYTCSVQGTAAHKTIVGALKKADLGDHDAIIVSRGGGSIEDLWAFNEPEVISAVSNCTTPIITGIGHARDQVLADLCADYAAPTPTAAAEIVAPEYHVLNNQIKVMLGTCGNIATTIAKQALLQYTHLCNNLRHPEVYLTNQQQMLCQGIRRMQINLHNQVKREQVRLGFTVARYNSIDLTKKNIALLKNSKQKILLSNQHIESKFKFAQMHLQNKLSHLGQHNPHLPLQKGYAYICDQNGKITISINNGDTITLCTQKQKIKCQVITVEEH